MFFFECYGDHRDLPVLTLSFPTRLASDLVDQLIERRRIDAGDRLLFRYQPLVRHIDRDLERGLGRPLAGARLEHPELALLHREFDRSEEHTSELQSLMRISYAVFCLKKKI